MALKNQQQEQEFDIPQGLDTTSPLPTMKPSFVRQARNTDVGLVGGYTKRLGYTNQITSVYGARDITAGIEYRPTSGVNETIVFGTTGTATNGRYGKLSAGAVTDIKTGLTGAARPTFIQGGKLLFFFNGTTDAHLYDGSGTRQIGITEPAAAPTLSSQTTGGNLTLLGQYIFAYTYYNSITRAESSPSPLLSVPLTGSNNKVNLGLTAGSSATADTINVYRTTANGNTLFLDGTALISATTYASTVADAGLGDQIDFDNSRIFDFTEVPNFPTVADNRIFVKTADNEIRFSKIGLDGPMFESFQANAFAPTSGRFGAYDRIVGLNTASQTPIVLKEKSIGRLDPIGIQDLATSFDPVQYQYKEISTTVGAVHHAAACQVLGELVFLSKDNVYATDGVNVRPIADTIQATIRTLGYTDAQVTQLSAHNDTEKRKVYISVFASGGAENPSMQLVGDYQFYPNFRWTTYEPGDNIATQPGITPGCFFAVTDPTTGKQQVWFGNSKANGKAYHLGDGNNDDGLAIAFKITTRPYFFSNPLKVKLAKLVDIQAQGDGNNYDLTVKSVFDLAGGESESESFSLSQNQALYDSAIYDIDVYSDEIVETVQYSLHQKMRYWQVVFEQDGADAPVSIFAWQVQASIFDIEKVG